MLDFVYNGRIIKRFTFIQHILLYFNDDYCLDFRNGTYYIKSIY